MSEPLRFEGNAQPYLRRTDPVPERNGDKEGYFSLMFKPSAADAASLIQFVDGIIVVFSRQICGTDANFYETPEHVVFA